jgi:hypothetical protein
MEELPEDPKEHEPQRVALYKSVAAPAKIPHHSKRPRLAHTHKQEKKKKRIYLSH